MADLTFAEPTAVLLRRAATRLDELAKASARAARGHPGGAGMSRSHRVEKCETTQPWVIYTYGRTHDGWWPLWNSTRILGRARIGMDCCVCGHTEVAVLRIPRLGPVPEPESGRHPARERFLADHAHPDRGHPMSWAQPLRNPHHHLDFDLLAMRIQADLDEARDLPDAPEAQA